MQQELIEMLDKMVKYFDEIPSDSYYYRETGAILNEAEKLVEKAKNSVKEPAVPQGEQSEEIESLRTQVGILKAAVESRGKTIEQIRAAAVPQGWTIRHIDGGISVTHKDGSGAFVRETENSERIIPSEILYRLCSDLIAVAPSQPAISEGKPLTFQEQQKEWAEYVNRCNSYDPPDRRHAFLAGLARGRALALTTPSQPVTQTDDLRQQLDVALGQVRYLLKDQAEKAAIIAALREKEGK